MCEQELHKSRRRVLHAVYRGMCGSNMYSLLLAQLWLKAVSWCVSEHQATSNWIQRRVKRH